MFSLNAANAKVIASFYRRFRDLPLLWKLLVPFLIILLMGSAGGFLIIRDFAGRNQETVDRELFRATSSVQAFIFAESSRLLDSVRLAANLEGMPQAVQAGNDDQVLAILNNVRTLQSSLNLLLITDTGGRGLIEVAGSNLLDGAALGAGTEWGGLGFIKSAALAEQHSVGDKDSDKWPGIVTTRGRSILAIAAPIKNEAGQTVGAAVAGIDLETVAAEALKIVKSGRTLDAGVGFSDNDGKVLADAGKSKRSEGPAASRCKDNSRLQPVKFATTVLSALEVDGRCIATVATSRPFDQNSLLPVLGGKLTLILLVVMAAVVGIGLLLSRFILAQVKPLLATNRAFGQGDLDARSAVLGKDELGELAEGFNQMADQLQASYQDLERKVEQRTGELRRVAEERAQALADREDFFGRVSHNFRTPLFVIGGQADLLLDPDYTPTGRSWRGEFATTIKTASDQLLKMVNEIINLTRLEKARIEPVPVQINEVLGEIEQTYRTLARQREIDIFFNVSQGIPTVWAEPAGLKEVLDNLLSNAIKYTAAGGSVDVKSETANGQVKLRIADSGVGIPKSVGDKIFEPFYQVKGTHAQRGEASSGLGLHIAKRLVESFGGSLTYTSMPGKGTVFTVTLRTAYKRSKRRQPIGMEV